MNIETYLKSNFPSLTLEPPLFYNWPIGIRFEIGVSGQRPLETYLNNAYERAVTIFDEINEDNDHLILVVDVFNQEVGKRNIKPFIKNQQTRKITLEKWFMEDVQVHRFSYTGKKQEFHYHRVLSKLCNKDFYSFLRSKDYIVYFINVEKNIIYYLYDDRGCDVISSNVNTIRPIFEKFNSWILDYDREKMENLFNK